jgi:hypothetical protein
MISFPTYKMLTGIADRTILISAVAAVRDGLVLHTSFKNDGRLPSAENRSFKLILFDNTGKFYLRTQLTQ